MLLLLLLLAMSVGRAESADPAVFVRGLYERQAAGEADPLFGAESKAALLRTFAEPLASLLWRDLVEADGEVGRMDSHYLFDAQDDEISNLEIHTLSNDGSNARVRTTFDFPMSHQSRRVEFHLVRIDREWRIANIHYQHGSELVETMRGPFPAAGDVREGERVFYCPSDKVRVLSDIEYARYGERSLKLDLYLPVVHAHPVPGVVVVHGGGWAASDRKQFAHVAAALAERGVAAAAIEYRTAEQERFPGAIQDVKAAIRWMRANAGAFGIIDRELGLLGGSSGAYMALFAAVTDGHSFYEGSGGNRGISSRVQGVVGMATPTDPPSLGVGGRRVMERFLGKPFADSPAMWALAAPVSHVDDLDPRVLLIHSRADEAVPVEQANEFAAHYRKEGIYPPQVELLPDAPHAFWNYHPWFTPTIDRAAKFFRTMRN